MGEREEGEGKKYKGEVEERLNLPMETVELLQSLERSELVAICRPSQLQKELYSELPKRS